ncbi:O-antigen ligase family protein [Trinickia acidisoli]|uniref:O-antigen ligase family protein n=1 Tax=Trinickia acidisoli TaxID=2767482 RepID=UPI001A8D370A|nr:O-antigen ligase family protein [Trinickia acidisoli]
MAMNPFRIATKPFKPAAPIAFLFVVFSFYPAIVLVEITHKGSSIRLYHVLALLCLGQLLIRRPLCFPARAKLIWSYFAVALLSNGYVYWQIGFNKQFIQLPFAALTFIFGFHLIRYLGCETVLTYFRKAAKLYLAVVAIKAILYINLFLRAAVVGQGAFFDVPWVSSGGPNIEATFCGIAAIFLLKDKRFWVALAVSIVISVLYQSRSGFIVCVMAALFKFHKKPNLKQLFASLLVLGLIAAVLVDVSTAQDNIVTRFLSIGSELDNDSVGRALLWTNGVELLMNHPWGSGIGNSFNLLEGQIGRALVENNFHNIYLQNTIDGGFQSGVLFALLLISTIRKSLRSNSGEHKVFGVALLAYAVTGFFQFVGYDVFGWLMIGICATLNSDREILTPPTKIAHDEICDRRPWPSVA